MYTGFFAGRGLSLHRCILLSPLQIRSCAVGKISTSQLPALQASSGVAALPSNSELQCAGRGGNHPGFEKELVHPTSNPCGISYLEQLGVNVQRVVQRYPAVFAGAPRRNVVIACEGVVQLLRNNGVNVVRAIEGYPNVLRLRIDTLQRTMDAITAVGHTVADVVHRYPNIFRLSEGDIDCMLRIGPQRVPQPNRLVHYLCLTTGEAEIQFSVPLIIR